MTDSAPAFRHAKQVQTRHPAVIVPTTRALGLLITCALFATHRCLFDFQAGDHGELVLRDPKGTP
ncbi:hypothetical protein [Amycolatopsis dongchuanensis]|uniref:Uncharacterized protein n=1 Tax=Amycolatopsis dongchuanensis TaxID=1070866 RepID=A0ABP9Q518_9PSEU